MKNKKPYFKLSMYEEEYTEYVRKGKKCVKCELTCWFGDYNFISIGKAICGSSDEYDYVRGKHIAQSRAKVNAFAIAKDLAANKLRIMQEEVDKYKNTIEIFETFKNDEKNHIHNDLIK